MGQKELLVRVTHHPKLRHSVRRSSWRITRRNLKEALPVGFVDWSAVRTNNIGMFGDRDNSVIINRGEDAKGIVHTGADRRRKSVWKAKEEFCTRHLGTPYAEMCHPKQTERSSLVD